MPDTPSGARRSSAMLEAAGTSWHRMMCAMGGMEHPVPE